MASNFPQEIFNVTYKLKMDERTPLYQEYLKKSVLVSNFWAIWVVWLAGYSQNLLATPRTDTSLQARSLCYIYTDYREISKIDFVYQTWHLDVFQSLHLFNISILYSFIQHLYFLSKLIISRKLCVISIRVMLMVLKITRVIVLVLYLINELKGFKVP